MSTLYNTYDTTTHPTELTFNLITNDPGCSFLLEDTTEDFNSPMSFGFYAEQGPDPIISYQYKKSWGTFINVIYWNKYNKYTDSCDATKTQSTLLTLLFEDGSEELVPQEYAFNRDGYYTVYRLFVLKKTIFEAKKAAYPGAIIIVSDDTVTLNTLLYGTDDGIGNITYTTVTDINDVVLLFESQTSGERITGTLSKKDIVSICYLSKCYDALNLLIIEQVSNPCLNSPSQFTATSGKSLFGFNSVNCLAIYNNPNMFKRDYIFMLISLVRLLVDQCEFTHAEKLIEDVIGTSTTLKCSLFTYLCGDTIVSNQIQTGCGCK